MTKAIRHTNINHKSASCPHCGAKSPRHSSGERFVKDIGHNRPARLIVRYSKHYCHTCRKCFNNLPRHYLVPSRKYTRRVILIARDLLNSGLLTLADIREVMRRKYFVDVPETTLHDWRVEFSEGLR